MNRTATRQLFLNSLLIALLPLGMRAQKSVADSAIAMFMPTVVYSGYGTAGTMAERFGYTSLAGADLGFKLRNNWYASLGGYFMFGDQVRENPIDPNFLTQFGLLITEDGEVSSFRLDQRGYTIPLRLGKIFHSVALPNTNPNSGLYVETGVQFIEHQISLSAQLDRIPYLSGDRAKGYDRLTNGLGVLFGIGYRHFSNNRFTNFVVGFDMSLNFTQNRRTVNYDTGLADTRSRVDMLVGFRVGWVLPVYKQAPEKFYYY